MSKVLQPKRDYSTWPTKQQAADLIGVSTKTIENYVKEKKIKQAKWKRPTGGPALAVYNPEDVNRLAHRMSTAVILDPGGVNAMHHSQHMAHCFQGQYPDVCKYGDDDCPAKPPNSRDQLAPIAPTLNGAALLDAVLRTIQKHSETSEKLFLTVPEAAEFTGLTQAYILRACQAGTLAAIKDAGWKIRRTALEGYVPTATA